VMITRSISFRIRLTNSGKVCRASETGIVLAMGSLTCTR
jgi:hypothetical protein